jgi:hypothetical protein
MKKIIILILSFSTSAFADPFLSTVNCAGPTLAYTVEASGGGPVPPPGWVTGHWVLLERAQQIDSEDISSTTKSACTVSFDQSSKVLLSVTPADQTESYFNYTIKLTAFCSSGPHIGKQYGEVVNCTELNPNPR